MNFEGVEKNSIITYLIRNYVELGTLDLPSNLL